MFSLFLELDRTLIFLLCTIWKSYNSSSCGEACNQKVFVSVDAVVGLELLATTLADKRSATLLPTCLLVRCLQSFESLVTDITRVNSLSLLCALFPHTNPIQQQHEFPHKLPCKSKTLRIGSLEVHLLETL